MRSKLPAVVATLALAAWATLSPASADAIVGNFTIDNGSATASGGQVTFSLNGDGTIAASLTTTLAGSFVGFGFDSIGTNLPESNFSPTAPDNAFGWIDMYGGHSSGFLCTACGTTETWTIGNPGDYTSVYQALGGGNSTYDFFLDASNGDQWAADAADAIAAPEPLTLSLFGAGLAGAVAMRRRRMTA